MHVFAAAFYDLFGQATDEDMKASMQQIPQALLPPIRTWVIASRESASSENLLRDEWQALPAMFASCVENLFAEFSRSYARAKHSLEQANQEGKSALIAKAFYQTKCLFAECEFQCESQQTGINIAGVVLASEFARFLFILIRQNL